MPSHMLCRKLRDRELGAVELTESMLNRISKQEKDLGCYLTVTGEDALCKAREVQTKLDSGVKLPPLAGIPIALKDNICTKGIRTTCASKMLENFIPPYSAAVAEKLDEEGMVLLGKLNMDEFAMGSSTETSYFKKTKNPWNPEFVPGGSGGGSAAAVSSGEAIMALGSDTGGSVRQPASFCGVVGMKPTYGTVSRRGLIAFASSLDQIGTLTKDVRDCALLMSLIAGHDPLDSTSFPMDHIDYTLYLHNDITGLKVAIPKEFMETGTDEDVKKCIYRAMETFEKLGANCFEISMPITEYFMPAYYIISAAEASSNLARFDGVRYGYRNEMYSGIEEMYKNTRSEGFAPEVKRRIMIGTFVLSSGYYDAYYKKALQVKELIKRQYQEAFQKYDVIMGPVTPSKVFRFGEKINDPIKISMGDIFTSSTNIAGLPGISVPCGFDDNEMPVGMHLIGKHFDEGTLLRTAYTFEQNTEYHLKKPPNGGKA